MIVLRRFKHARKVIHEITVEKSRIHLPYILLQVSVHLIFPADRPPALKEIARIEDDCIASDFQKDRIETERKEKRMSYPINVARNVARMQANTTRVLVIDIELLPSDKLASGFMQIVRGRQPRTGIVFVVPVFEIESYETPPSTKRELLLATKAGIAVYFHRFVISKSQENNCVYLI